MSVGEVVVLVFLGWLCLLFLLVAGSLLLGEMSAVRAAHRRRGAIRRRIERTTDRCGSISPMSVASTLTSTERIDERGDKLQVFHLELTEFDMMRMSERQWHDLQAGVALLRAAMLRDEFFRGHPCADDDTIASVMERVEIVHTLDEVQALPEAAPKP